MPSRECLALGLEYSEINQPGEVRVAAIGYLQTLGPDSRAALNRLIDLLEDDDVGVRRAAIDGLAAVGTARARAALERRRATEPQPLLKTVLEQALRLAASSNE